MSEFKDVSLRDLLGLHAGIMDELRRRGVARSANNPTGSLAEFLFCRAFSWEQADNSQRGYDAFDGNGKRYQIKGRRLHRYNRSRQLSAREAVRSRFCLILLQYSPHIACTYSGRSINGFLFP